MTLSDFRLSPLDLRASVHGALELEERPDGGVSPLRLPAWTRPLHADGGIDRMSAHTSGVRLELETAASVIRLVARFTRTVARNSTLDPHPIVVAAAADRGGMVVRMSEGDLLVENPDRSAERVRGELSTVLIALPPDDAGARRVTVWLPHAAATTLHSVSADAPITAAAVRMMPRWLHYGSSISHGSDLDDPRRPWPQQAATALGLDLVNLGFAGNAMLDPFVARAIAAAPADLITLKVGINIVNGDTMRRRTFVPALHNFLDLVREGHPTTPVKLITALACPIHEHTPGPTREESPGKAGATPRETRPGDGTLTLSLTRELMAAVVDARADASLELVSGLDLLAESDARHLSDNLHPDGAGHDLIARRFVALARREDPAAWGLAGAERL